MTFLEKLENFEPPIAMPGDKVEAHNFKKKTKDGAGKMIDAGIWENGTVTDTKTVWTIDGETGKVNWNHSYTVLLDRTSINKKGRESPLFLHVGEDKILMCN